MTWLWAWARVLLEWGRARLSERSPPDRKRTAAMRELRLGVATLSHPLAEFP